MINRVNIGVHWTNYKQKVHKSIMQWNVPCLICSGNVRVLTVLELFYVLNNLSNKYLFIDFGLCVRVGIYEWFQKQFIAVKPNSFGLLVRKHKRSHSNYTFDINHKAQKDKYSIFSWILDWMLAFIDVKDQFQIVYCALVYYQSFVLQFGLTTIYIWF